MRTATDWDHRIIDAVSVALKGSIGADDDVERLLKEVRGTPNVIHNVDGHTLHLPKTGREREKNLAEIAIAFIRWAQDLKEERKVLQNAKSKASSKP